MEAASIGAQCLVLVVGGTTLLFTTRDFPDRHSALAYRKQVGQRDETTMAH